MTSRLSIAAPDGLTALPLKGIPRIESGDDLSGLIEQAAKRQEIDISGDDVLVVAQKVVSKAEGAFMDLRTVVPGDTATALAIEVDKDARLVEVILSQSRRIVRKTRGVLITETVHGLICANAGIDASNGLGPETVTLLPADSDASADRIRSHFEVNPAVIISDSFNRPWREGSVNVAIGTAGFYPLLDGRGLADDTGRELKSTKVSLADEIASAAQLVMGETGGVPVAIVRGLRLQKSNAGSAVLLRDPARDLFR